MVAARGFGFTLEEITSLDVLQLHSLLEDVAYLTATRQTQDAWIRWVAAHADQKTMTRFTKKLKPSKALSLEKTQLGMKEFLAKYGDGL